MLKKFQTFIDFLTQIPRGWRKYLITIIVFLVYLIFFDTNNLLFQFKQIKTLKKLRYDRQYFIDAIKENKQKVQELTDTISYESLEKFARKQYLMKKNNEDIFLIVYE